MGKKTLHLLIIFTTVVFLYHPVLLTYFSQDDFFHFKVSQTNGSIGEFINLFGFHSFKDREIAFYRPISRELPFNVFYSIFGLNPIPFRILCFLIHFINIYLVYTLVLRLFNNKYLSFFVSFFFGITAANVATLYYLAGGIQTLLATTFTLSSILIFQEYLKTHSLKFKFLTFLMFLLAISSHEQAMIIPFLLIGLIFLSKHNKSIKKYLEITPFFVIIFILLSLEVFKIGFSSIEQQYQLVFSIKRTFNSLFWYSGWALGIPETLIDFVLPGLRLNPTLLRYWSNYYIFIFPSFFITLILLFVATMYLIIRKRRIFTDKVFLYTLAWFPLGLLPVILLPLHKSTHYLTISLPAFWILVGYIIFSFHQQIKNQYFSKIFVISFIVSLITLSTVSAILGSTNYWAATRGKLAEKLINHVKDTYPNLPKGAIIYFKNDPTYPYLTKEWGNSSYQASVILNGSDALQLLYKDSTLQVYYGDIKKPTSSENLYSIMAKIY